MTAATVIIEDPAVLEVQHQVEPLDQRIGDHGAIGPPQRRELGRLDQRAVNAKAFTADQPFFQATLQHALEHMPQQVAVPEPPMPVL